MNTYEIVEDNNEYPILKDTIVTDRLLLERGLDTDEAFVCFIKYIEFYKDDKLLATVNSTTVGSRFIATEEIGSFKVIVYFNNDNIKGTKPQSLKNIKALTIGSDFIYAQRVNDNVFAIGSNTSNQISEYENDFNIIGGWYKIKIHNIGTKFNYMSAGAHGIILRSLAGKNYYRGNNTFLQYSPDAKRSMISKWSSISNSEPALATEHYTSTAPSFKNVINFFKKAIKYKEEHPDDDDLNPYIVEHKDIAFCLPYSIVTVSDFKVIDDIYVAQLEITGTYIEHDITTLIEWVSGNPIFLEACNGTIFEQGLIEVDDDIFNSFNKKGVVYKEYTGLYILAHTKSTDIILKLEEE